MSSPHRVPKLRPYITIKRAFTPDIEPHEFKIEYQTATQSNLHGTIQCFGGVILVSTESFTPQWLCTCQDMACNLCRERKVRCDVSNYSYVDESNSVSNYG